jgi:glucokinase
MRRMIGDAVFVAGDVIVAGDIGGTHARFCLATLQAGRVQALGTPITLLAREHASLGSAWESFCATLDQPVPRFAALALACPIIGETLQLTNNPWVIRPAALATELAVERVMLINDFAAVAHAVAQLPDEQFTPLCGPAGPLPAQGVLSIIGPGTGLGVAQLWRDAAGAKVVACEGGHMDFAPLDALEDAILRLLRLRYTRVSVERIVSGPGLKNIFEALAEIEGRPVHIRDDKELWAAAIAGEDTLATAALARFCACLGAAAGDFALAQGAAGVVIAGGILPRIIHKLPDTGFASRFVAKGRFERMMSAIPVRALSHPHPGLWGAAAAFAAGQI